MKAYRRIILLLSILMVSIPVMNAPEQAPGFALPDNHGSMIFKSSIQGNMIISFFASYCRPCAKELPVMIELEKKYAKQKQLSIVLIATDSNDSDGEAREKAGRFLKKIGVNQDYLLDVYQVVIAKYNPRKELPATFLVNRAGYIVFKEVGAREDTIQRLEKAIQGLW